MGFGILVAGYTFLLSIPLHSMGVCAELIGFILMLRALLLLKAYQRDYGRAAVVTACMLPLGVYSIFLQILMWLGKEELHDKISHGGELIYSLVLAVMLLLLHHFLLAATQKQAKEVDLPDIVLQARRNRIVTFIYIAVSVILPYLNTPKITEVVQYASLVSGVSLFGIIWLLLNTKMLFNCYMWICLPGDEDMPMRESKIPSLFKVLKPVEPTEEELRAKKRAEFDEEVRRRQLARTKRNKRWKK